MLKFLYFTCGELPRIADMNHRKHADSCSFLRNDARAQQAGGVASLREIDGLKTSPQNFVDS